MILTKEGLRYVTHLTPEQRWHKLLSLLRDLLAPTFEAGWKRRHNAHGKFAGSPQSGGAEASQR